MEVERVTPAPKAALPLGAFGALLLIAGATAWGMAGRLGPLASLFLAIGGLNLAIALWIGRSALGRFLGSRRGRAGANVAAVSVLATALWVIVNAISARTYVLHDLTAERSFSLSARTRAVLADVAESDKEILVTVLDHSDPLVAPFLDRTLDLLEAYAAETTALVVERIDLEFEPMRAELFVQRFRDVPPEARNGAVAFECAGRKHLVTAGELMEGSAEGFRFRGEEAFTSAILSVTEARRKRVRFLTGHGEAGFGTASEFDVNVWASELRRLNVDVEALDLPTKRRIPEFTDLVVIANPDPEAEFTERELRILERYLDAGGSLMVMIEPQSPLQLERGLRPDLPRWLEKYGARLAEGEMVLDPPASVAAVPIAFLANDYGDHEITREIAALPLRFRVCRPIEPALDNPKGYAATTLVSTSPEGWVETDITEESLQRAKPDPSRDRTGPVPLAIALESEASGSRIVVVGDADPGLDTLIEHYPNRAFVMGCTNWLLRRAPLVSLPSRPLEDRRLLDVSRAQLSTLFWLAVVALPLLALGTGLGVAVLRRR